MGGLSLSLSKGPPHPVPSGAGGTYFCLPTSRRAGPTASGFSGALVGPMLAAAEAEVGCGRRQARRRSGAARGYGGQVAGGLRALGFRVCAVRGSANAQVSADFTCFSLLWRRDKT